MKEQTKKTIIQEPKEIEITTYIAEDGREFTDKFECLEYERLDMIEKKKLRSKLINNEYLNQYFKPFQLVKFNTPQQIEVFEQKMCGNKDDNTWGSWLSIKAKIIKYPIWLVCSYVYHESGDYTAIYLTLDEAEKDLLNVVDELRKLKEGN